MTFTVDYLAVNTSRSLFRDVRLRKAVNYAINRRALVEFRLLAGSAERCRQVS